MHPDRREPERARGWRERIARFFECGLWERDVDELPLASRVFFTTLRVEALVRHGIGRHQIGMRAAALTFTTIFSLIPTLAVAFLMFSAFGGLESARDVLLPRILDYLAVGVRDEAGETVRLFLDNINAGTVGALGLVFLIIAVVSLLGGLEDAFNDIWGVTHPRTYLQRVLVYWTVLTIAPTLLVGALSLSAAVDRLLPLRWLLEKTGTVELFFGTVLPLVLSWIAFALLYTFMTSARVRPNAALVGGIVAGTSWSLAAWGYAWYARTTVYYATVYGSLGAIPIFLFWAYLSWIFVLLGAQVAFAVQNLASYREEVLAPRANQATSEILALRIVVELARRFLRADPPPAPDELARELHASGRLVNQVVERLIELCFVLRTGEPARLVPARDPRTFGPAEVLARLRDEGEVAWPDMDDTAAALAAMRAQAEQSARRTWGERTFADLAGVPEPDARTSRPAIEPVPDARRIGDARRR